jgi:hypothetical protein
MYSKAHVYAYTPQGTRMFDTRMFENAHKAQECLTEEMDPNLIQAKNVDRLLQLKTIQNDMHFYALRKHVCRF